MLLYTTISEYPNNQNISNDSRCRQRKPVFAVASDFVHLATPHEFSFSIGSDVMLDMVKL